MLRGGPEPSGFLSIRSCSLVFFSSSDRLLLARICLLFTASSFASFRKLALRGKVQQRRFRSGPRERDVFDQQTIRSMLCFFLFLVQ